MLRYRIDKTMSRKHKIKREKKAKKEKEQHKLLHRTASKTYNMA